MTRNNFTNLSRAEKILITLYELGDGKRPNLKYEDIVVAVFHKFPDDFHLRGYSEYPDSGDLIHKPLYDFRKRGFLEANNKVFSLTERGVAYADQLVALIKGKDLKSDGRLSRYAEKEISRIESSESFGLFHGDRKDRITDTDFYSYLSVTPRTSRNDFLGRLKTVEDAIQELQAQKSLTATQSILAEYHLYMMEKFLSIVQHFKSLQK